jgi:hypothetical protein
MHYLDHKVLRALIYQDLLEGRQKKVLITKLFIGLNQFLRLARKKKRV